MTNGSTSMLELKLAKETRTPQELAASEFLARVADVAGVRCVQAENGTEDGAVNVTVQVDSLRSEAARRVFDMESVIRRKFRGSNFTVRVRESAHLGIATDEP